MALQNAFAALALDATVAAVGDLLTSILGRFPAAVDPGDGGLPVHIANPSGSLTNTQLRAAAVSVDGSAVTQPVSAAAFPLPAGASTEATLADLDAVAERASRFLSPSRAIPYARTSSDQIRVVVDSFLGGLTNMGQIGAVDVLWGLRNTTPAYYSEGAPASIDMRELLKVQSRANARSARARWSLT